MAVYNLGNYLDWAPNQGGSGFGGKDWDYAKNTYGLNAQQMKILGGLQIRGGRAIGQRVYNEMDALGAVNPWDYGADGGWGFGGSDIQSAVAQGRNYNEIKGYVDHARQYGINVGAKADKWLTDNKDNYEYMDAAQRREVSLADAKAAEERQQAQWLENLKIQKEMNPRTTSQNAQMQTGKAGGVAIKRSDDFRKEGGTRSTKQAGRQMFIGGLNI